MRILLPVCLMLATLISSAQESLKEMRSSVKEVIGGKEYYIHTVKKGQSLYMISKAYQTDVNTIIQDNPEVREGLKPGMKLRIPVPGSGQKATEKKQEPSGEKAQPAPPPPEEAVPCDKVRPDPNTVYKVALMMPLYLGDVSSIETNPSPGEEEPEYRSLRFIEFYEGFMMAMDSLEKSGLSLKLYVYDVSKDTLKTKSLLRQSDVRQMNLIIGLVYSRNFQILSQFAKENHIPLVNPVSEREQILTGNPMIFKVQPGLNSQPEHLAEYLASHFSDANLLAVANDKDAYGEASGNLQKACANRHLDLKITGGYDEVTKLLSKEKENVVVFYAAERVYALDLITKLNELRADYKITLVGLPQWADLEDDLEAEYLVNLKTRVLAPWFVDYEDPETKKFVKAFQQKYFTDPDPLAFQGFDVAFYFLSALQKFGNHFYPCIPSFRMKSLQTDFQFESTGNNGFENQHWAIYSYGDYSKHKEN
ncbi:MAG TPA: ABC transporter substrate-binding protein [Bacteroidales bacterium]|nr:ABC transporter substrate-binding protein [Bacteroidales bacterium]